MLALKMPAGPLARHFHKARLIGPRLTGAALIGALSIGTIGGLTGCGSTLAVLVGEKGGNSVPPATATMPTVLPDTSFLSDSDLKPGYTSDFAVPPTLSTDNDAGPPQPDATPNLLHRPIAITPISSDPAALVGLGQAANRKRESAAGRFVLLVLTPPATDAATMDRGIAASRAAAAAAIRALGDAGISSDRIEISLATNPDVGNGELRLYPR